MTTEEMIEIMKAFQEGKRIEIKDKRSENDEWTDITFPNWNWVEYYYRIKPEPKEPTYRPYNSIEEMLEDVKKRHVNIQNPVFGGIWLKEKGKIMYEVMITAIDYKGSKIMIGKNWAWLNVKDLFDNYTYLDGSPVGIKE